MATRVSRNVAGRTQRLERAAIYTMSRHMHIPQDPPNQQTIRGCSNYLLAQRTEGSVIIQQLCRIRIEPLVSYGIRTDLYRACDNRHRNFCMTIVWPKAASKFCDSCPIFPISELMGDYFCRPVLNDAHVDARNFTQSISWAGTIG